MTDINFDTRLVVLGNDGTDDEVWYESSDGTMVELDTSAQRLTKEAQTAVIPGFQKVYFAQGTIYRYADFATSPPTWNAWTASDGALPENANIGCLYRARIVLAGNTVYPHMWEMSRQGDPDRWLYGANDAQSAVAGGDSVAAQSGDMITALIPYNDDYLIIGGAHSVELMMGDPAAGGSLNEILATDGVFGPLSWCFDPIGNLYFAGTVGIYKMERGGGIPTPISLNRIPDMMSGIDRNLYRITMAYDAINHGVLICITKISDGTGTHYWYDVRTDGFFPETYPGTMGAYSVFFYDSDSSTYRGLLVGCEDGYLREFDKDTHRDDAIAITSKVLLGPADLSVGDRQGKINNLVLTLGNESSHFNCNYYVYANNSAEELLDDVVAAGGGVFSGTITSGGRKNNIRGRARGAALAVYLTNSLLSTTFALEKISANVEPAGRVQI